MAIFTPILAAEDDENDALFLQMALEDSGLKNPLVIARDGQVAVDYLSGVEPYEDRAAHPLPGLLLLDLKMPRMSGFDVLAWLAERPQFENLPVVVLSSSTNDLDIQKARQLGAHDYLAKPNDFRKLTKMLQDVAARWLGGGPTERAKPAVWETADAKGVEV